MSAACAPAAVPETAALTGVARTGRGVARPNKHRHLACQFAVACDSHKDVIREPEVWERAKKISKAMLDGQIWLPEVDKSTHYHA